MTSNPRIPGRRFLHSPGPTPLPDAVLAAMARQPMDLADPRFDANLAAVVAPVLRDFSESRGASERAACFVALTRIRHAHPGLDAQEGSH